MYPLCCSFSSSSSWPRSAKPLEYDNVGGLLGGIITVYYYIAYLELHERLLKSVKRVKLLLVPWCGTAGQRVWV